MSGAGSGHDCGCAVDPRWGPVLHALGLGRAEAWFSHPAIRAWRTLPDRDNATLETDLGLLHVKRHHRPGRASPIEAELAALRLLKEKEIPTLEVVAHGTLADGRAFSASPDLTGYASGQVLMREGMSFAKLAGPTAQLAARLHQAGLHHRDLYLCHFFLVRSGMEMPGPQAKLIDISRVRRLPMLLAKRWVVKDLAQFWYSAESEFGVTRAELERWVSEYAGQRGIRPEGLLGPIQRKVKAIARHDARLQAVQPTRNVSLSVVERQ